jgi:hypothetical protein
VVAADSERIADVLQPPRRARRAAPAPTTPPAAIAWRRACEQLGLERDDLV